VIDHHRSRGRRGSDEPNLLSETQLPRARERAADDGLAPELAPPLCDLSERERELISLRYIADLSGPQIATVTRHEPCKRSPGALARDVASDRGSRPSRSSAGRSLRRRAWPRHAERRGTTDR